MKKDKIIEIISSCIICLFSYAAISKLAVYTTFVDQLSKSPFLTKFSTMIAWVIPTAELVIAGLLLIRRLRVIGLYAAFFLMSLFTLYIYAMLNFSYDVPCSCGGVLSQMNWQQHLIFNIVFTLLSLLGIILDSLEKKDSTYTQLDRSITI